MNFAKPAAAFLFTVSLILAAGDALGAKVAIEGSVPRGSDVKRMLVTLTLSGVTAAERGTVDLKTILHGKVQIYLDNHSENDVRLKYADEVTTIATPTLEGLVLEKREEYAEEIETDTATTLITYKFYLIDNGATEGLQELLDANDGTIRMSADFTTADAKEDSGTGSIVQKTGVANAAPEGLKVTSNHHGLSVLWTKADTIPFNDDTEDSPSGTVVFLVDTTDLSSATGDAGLAAITYKEDKDEETTDTTCDFVSNTDSCSVQCGSGVYLDFATIAENEAVQVSELDASDDDAAFSDLDPERNYAAFAMYQPDGVQVSECVIGKPKVNTSLTEMNGGKDAEPANPRCFIATAAYGSPLDRHVDLLRWFRDSYLLRFKWGRQFVREYYKRSPAVAAIIAREPVLRSLTRGLLWAPVQYVVLLRKAPIATLAVSLTLAYIALVAVTSCLHQLWRRRRAPTLG